jgi:hypothetical protein
MMMLVVVKVITHKKKASCSMICNTWKAFLSPAGFFFDRLTYNTFLYQHFSVSNGFYCSVDVVLHRCVRAEHSLACTAGHYGYES